MEKTLIASGKTIDLAIESALAQLGLDRDSVSVQVLQQAKAGFLGFGAQPAKVQVTYEVPDPKPEPKAPEKPKSALGSASRSKPKAPVQPVKKPETPKAPEAPKAEPVKEAPKAEKPAAPKAPKTEKPKKPAAPKAPKAETPKAPAEPKTFAVAEEGSVEQKIEVFIKGLIEHMDSTAVPHAWKAGDNTYQVELVGDDLGYLIGRRGDTLDAIQHLANYTVNREVEGHIRINVVLHRCV